MNNQIIPDPPPQLHLYEMLQHLTSYLLWPIIIIIIISIGYQMGKNSKKK